MTIVSSILLFISEILPYVSQVNGNGIIDIIVNSYSKYKQVKQVEQVEQVEEEKKLINYETIDKKLDEILEKITPRES